MGMAKQLLQQRELPLWLKKPHVQVACCAGPWANWGLALAVQTVYVVHTTEAGDCLLGCCPGPALFRFTNLRRAALAQHGADRLPLRDMAVALCSSVTCCASL